eukprot:gene18585-20450_t
MPLKTFSSDVLSRLCGVAADDPYQATGFRTKIMQEMGLGKESENHLNLPVTWDAAHLLNLAVLDVKVIIGNSKSDSGKHFQSLLSAAMFSTRLWQMGKDLLFCNLWILQQEDLFPVQPRAFLDTMKPIVDLQLRVQSLDAPLWKLKLWCPRVKREMEKMSSGEPGSFPRLKNVTKKLKPGNFYNGVTLFPGWLITESPTGGLKDKKIYSWSLRDDEEIEQNHANLARDLMISVSERIEPVISNEVFAPLEVFDAQY